MSGRFLTVPKWHAPDQAKKFFLTPFLTSNGSPLLADVIRGVRGVQFVDGIKQEAA